MQIQSFRSVLLPTHTHTHTQKTKGKKMSQLEQHCLTQLFSRSDLCAPLVSRLPLCVGEKSGCTGNDIWETSPQLMYNTTKTLPSNAASESKAPSSLTAALKVSPSRNGSLRGSITGAIRWGKKEVFKLHLEACVADVLVCFFWSHRGLR